ncbi:TraR/DksA C4-type zinc finger protein [Virgibacillus sp. W0181]|uniref:TraR/DksA C4-type zinc finger protein n=1 Tax=Virgibacillus sp. W0181 TaxID=3391581 RepID=UPI003F44CA5B
MLTKEQLSHLKSILIERQNELIQHMDNRYGLSVQSSEAVGELSMYDNHPADMGTETFERGKDLALVGHAEKELEQINEAIHAVEENTYGICSKCGQDIPYERLTVVPTTDRCHEHAVNNTFSRERPVEEEVFSPNINPDEVTEENQVGYDAEDAWQDVSRYGTSETASDFYGDRDDYNEMYPNSDELVGSTESVESFLAANMDGSYKENTPNHRKYEEDEFE